MIKLISPLQGTLSAAVLALAMLATNSAPAADDDLKSDTLRFTLKNSAGFCVGLIQMKDMSYEDVNEDNTNFCAPGQSRVKTNVLPGPNSFGEFHLEYNVVGSGGLNHCDMVRVWTEDRDGIRRITKYRIDSTGKYKTFNDKNNPQMVTFVFDVSGIVNNRKCTYKEVKRRKL